MNNVLGRGRVNLDQTILERRVVWIAKSCAIQKIGRFIKGNSRVLTHTHTRAHTHTLTRTHTRARAHRGRDCEI